MLKPGSVLASRYSVQRQIGRGGMAVVYRAADMRLGHRPMAVKEMDPGKVPGLSREWALTAFRQEAQVLARLNHPGIAAVTDFFEEGGFWYLVTEYVEGQDLQQLLDERGRFDQERVLRWAVQLSKMLQYLHSQDPPVIFRDLKPSNVMVQADGTLKLIDFGIARFFKPGKSQDTIHMGTPGYSAPEQFGEGQTDARSDVYSLGVLLHQLLTGYRPSLSPMNLPPVEQLRPEISPVVCVAIEQAIRLDPAVRFQSIQAFARALDIGQTFGAPTPDTQETISPVPVAGKSRFRLAGRIAAVLILMATVITTGWWLLTRPETTPPPTFVDENIDGSDDPEPMAEDPPTPNSTPSFLAESTKPSQVAPAPGETPTGPMPDPTNTPTPSPTPSATATRLPQMGTRRLGSSSNNRPLTLWEIGDGPRKVILIGGLHGNEPATEELVLELVYYFQDHPDQVGPNASLSFVPALNPDGLTAGDRYTPGGVDLNRNWDTPSWTRASPEPGGVKANSGGSRPFSEPETAALRDWLLELAADPGTESIRIIVYHRHVGVDASGIVQPGYIEYANPVAFSVDLARTISASAGYHYIPAWIGTYTPTGELIQWCAIQGIAAVDIELPADGRPRTRPTGSSSSILEGAIESLKELMAP